MIADSKSFVNIVEVGLCINVFLILLLVGTGSKPTLSRKLFLERLERVVSVGGGE